ncbi:MAG: phage portal protein [Youngiibacter sp.]|nr:phage portal protein [Youngiibacter sp.]
MFSRLLEFIRQVIAKMFPKSNMADALNIEIPVSDAMSDAIDLWQSIYMDEAPWVDGEKVKSLNLGAAIASEIARLTTIEMATEITSNTSAAGPGKKYADLNKDYQRVIDKLKNNVEYAAAKGGMILKPYMDENRIIVDFAQADQFFPTRFSSSGEIVGCIFTEIKNTEELTYTRLEHHDLVKGVYTITNKAYVAKKGDEKLGTEVSLTDVAEWADLAESAVFRGLERPLFAYFKMPLANSIDTSSHLGVSIYCGAVDLLEQADKMYSRALWEYEGGEMAIDATLDLFKADGTMPEGKDRLFRQLDADSKDEPFYKVFNPTLRDENFWYGLNKILQRIEFSCGLAYGTLSDMQIVSKTAEEIKSSKQRSFATVADVQKNLQTALEELVWAMQAWRKIGELLAGDNKQVKEIVVDEGYAISFDWDDSLIVDEKMEQAILMQEVSAGIVSGDWYLKKRYGATDEQIKEMKASLIPAEDEDDGQE